MSEHIMQKLNNIQFSANKLPPDEELKEFNKKNAKIIDEVSENDRLWFEKHEGEDFRIRPFVKGESYEENELTFVIQLEPGLRIRSGAMFRKELADIYYKYKDKLKKELEENEKEINTDISELKGETNEYVKTKIIEKFKRDYKLVKDLKQKHNNCQLCGFTFKKKNGENYNETHHIIQLSEGGKDAEINTLVLCANCHRKLHYADVDITNVLKKEIKINGELIRWK